jgi:hypothetical protein
MQCHTEASEVHILVLCNAVKLLPLQGPACLPISGNGTYNMGAGITTGHGLDDRGGGVRVPVGARIFSS